LTLNDLKGSYYALCYANRAILRLNGQRWCVKQGDDEFLWAGNDKVYVSRRAAVWPQFSASARFQPILVAVSQKRVALSSDSWAWCLYLANS